VLQSKDPPDIILFILWL